MIMEGELKGGRAKSQEWRLAARPKPPPVEPRKTRFAFNTTLDLSGQIIFITSFQSWLWSVVCDQEDVEARGGRGKSQEWRLAPRPQTSEASCLTPRATNEILTLTFFFSFFLSLADYLCLGSEGSRYRIVSYRIGSDWIGLIRHHENRGGGEHDPLSAHRYAHAYQRAGSGRGR